MLRLYFFVHVHYFFPKQNLVSFQANFEKSGNIFRLRARRWLGSSDDEALGPWDVQYFMFYEVKNNFVYIFFFIVYVFYRKLSYACVYPELRDCLNLR